MSAMDEWKGMPEFEQPAIKPVLKVTIQFRTHEAVKQFEKLTGISLAGDVKTAYYPPAERGVHARKRWVQEE